MPLDERDKEMLKAWDKRARLAWLLLGLTMLMFVLLYTTKCAPGGGGEEPAPAPGPGGDPTACGGLDPGDVKAEDCPGSTAKRLLTCSTNGQLIVTQACPARTPDPGACVPWEPKVKAVLSEYCVSCHQGKLDNFDTSRAWSPKIVERITIAEGASNPRFMPPQGSEQLDADDLEVLKAWDASGANRTCAQGGGGGGAQDFADLDYIENAMLNDLTAADAGDRENYRYLIAAHKLNEGESNLAATEQAINKTINSISLDRDIFKAVAVDPKKVVWRIDIDELDINANEWKLIEAADTVKIQSKTSRGELISALTKASTPWFHFESFSDITQKAEVYHALLDIPPTFAQFAANQGVDFAGDLKDGEATVGCFEGSSIGAALGDRMVAHFDSRDGDFWITFDPLALNGDQTRNCFKNPLLAATGSQRTFNFAASEVIFTLPNGMPGYALFAAGGSNQDVRNNQGQIVRRRDLAPNARANAAPLTIVADNQAPVGVGPEIKNAVSCHRCHAGGILPFRDQVRSAVQQSASEFNAQDFELILETFKAQREIDETIKESNDGFQGALRKAGVDIAARDPINQFRDPFKLGWNLKRASSFLFLTEQQMQQAINQSQTARAELAPLLAPGGSVNADVFLATLPALIRDARLFEDPL